MCFWPSFLASMVYITSLYFGHDKLQLIYLLQMIYNLGRNANCTVWQCLGVFVPALTERESFHHMQQGWRAAVRTN